MNVQRNSLLPIILLILLLSIAFTGCSEKEEKWVFKPMVSKDNALFGDTGHTKEILSDEWMMIGKIEKNIPQYEPMIKGEKYYISNTLPAGTEIYGSEKDASIIYAKNNNTYIKYEMMEDNQ